MREGTSSARARRLDENAAYKQIGVYETPELGIAALLERAMDAAAL